MKKINVLQFPVLKTERVILRQLRIEDAQAISDLRNDENVNRYIDRPKDCSIEKAMDFILKRDADFKQKNWLYWAICLKENPKLIGTACQWNYTDDLTAEIGYELSPEFQGQGLMNEVLQRILDFSFNVLGLKKLEAFTHKDNEKSIRLLERNKFVMNTEKKDDIDPNYIIFSLTNNHEINQ